MTPGCNPSDAVIVIGVGVAGRISGNWGTLRLPGAADRPEAEASAAGKNAMACTYSRPLRDRGLAVRRPSGSPRCDMIL